MIKWLVFDIGGVVLNHSREAAFEEFRKHDTRDPAVVYTKLERDGTLDRWQTGRIKEHEVIRCIASHFDNALDERTIRHCVAAELLDVNPGTIALVEALRGSAQIACFSNTIPLHWEFLRTKYRILDLFDAALASHLLGAAKPSAEAFSRAAFELGAAENECLLIDDKQENVSGARRSGWRAIQFSNPAKLRAALANFRMHN